MFETPYFLDKNLSTNIHEMLRTKLKVFQIQRGKFRTIGEVMTTIPDSPYLKDIIWDLCNYSCWSNKNPRKRGGIKRNSKTVFYPTRNAEGYCNSDIYISMKGKYFVADPVGWKEFNKEEDARKYLK